ncbi:MAG: sulfotransferase family 2 domain-containing protein [Pseudomonadota bacterium]
MAFYCLKNESRKFIICVNPKCGCTTIRDWFVHTLEESLSEVDRSCGRYMIPPETLHLYPDYFKALVVQNPLRRLVSFYYKFVVTGSERWCHADQEAILSLENHTFRQFIRVLTDLAIRSCSFQHHLVSQTEQIKMIPFDEVIKTKDIAFGLKRINQRLGIVYEPLCLNASGYSDARGRNVCDITPDELSTLPVYSYDQFYDSALREMVSALYADDIHYYESI